MSPPDTLAPDQRAVLELVLLQGRSYGELSELLAIPEHDVRARADAGLRALAGEPAAGVDSGRIADWLLGQQPETEAARTRAAVERSPAANEWAATAAERLRTLGDAPMPDVPPPHETSPTDRNGDATAARPEPHDPGARPEPHDPGARPEPHDPGARPGATPSMRSSSKPAATARAVPRPTATLPRSSKLGGAVLIGALVLIVGAGLVLLFTTGGDDPEPAAQQQPQQQPQASPTAPEAAGNDIVLTGTGGSNAQGLMRLMTNNAGKVQFAIAAENVPPNQGREVYAVWFTRGNGDARRLGFAQAQVGEEGVLTTGGPQRADEDRFPRWFATYDKVLITRETKADARRPGPAVLEGTLPGEG